MKLIAHRGLIDGPDKNLENVPDHIVEVLSLGYDCEIDLWRIYGEWWLGHDEPTYKVNAEFIGKQGLWLHCKNLDALYALTCLPFNYEYFWHQNDDFTLTSSNKIWTYPKKHLTFNSVAVLPEICENYWNYIKDLEIHGVCTDYVEKFISEISTMSVRAT